MNKIIYYIQFLISFIQANSKLVGIALILGPVLLILLFSSIGSFTATSQYDHRSRNDPNSLAETVGRSIGIGTGFYINERNLVTNNHVVEHCKTIKVRSNFDIEDAKVIYTDPVNDLALLETKYNLSSILIFSHSLTPTIGEQTYFPDYSSKPGIFYLLKFSIEGIDKYNIYTSWGTLRGGNSGSPLLDHLGYVIGINKGEVFGRGILGDSSYKQYDLATTTLTLKQFLYYHHVTYYEKDEDANLLSNENYSKFPAVNVFCFLER